MNKIRLFLVGTLVALLFSSGFLLIYSSISSVDKQVTNVTNTTTVSLDLKNIQITKFTPALYVGDDFLYAVVENNTFKNDEVWFFIQLDDISTNYSNNNYSENYYLFLSIVDSNSNIIYNFNNTLIYQSQDVFDSPVGTEAVRFKLNTESFSAGKYYLRLSAVDAISKTNDYYDSYFVIKR